MAWTRLLVQGSCSITLPLAFGQMPGGVFFCDDLLRAPDVRGMDVCNQPDGAGRRVDQWSGSVPQVTSAGRGDDWPADLGGRFRHGAVLQRVGGCHLLARHNLRQSRSPDQLNIMLPLGGLLIVGFAGWVMCRNSTADELGGAGNVYRLWRFLARVVAPIGILFVFLKAVGLLPDLS